MDLSEMLQSVKDAVSGAWGRASFLIRTHALVSLLVFVVLGGGLVWWGSTGFSFGIGRFFAAQTPPSGGPVTKCNPLTGNGKRLTDWRPQVTPQPTDPSEALPPCAPLTSMDNATFPGFSVRSFDPVTNVWATPVPPVPPQKDWARCLVVLDRRSEYPNFTSMTDPVITVPSLLRENKDASLFYKALVINNCPWTVRLTLQVDGDPDVKTAAGAGSRQKPISEGESRRAFSRDPVTVGDFPSCWNNGSGFGPLSCGKEVTIRYNLDTYTCGSVGFSLKWWHFTNNNAVGEYTPDDPALKRDVNGVVNYGLVCTGSSGERQPGTLGEFPVDPSGACEFREQFNAPDGAWFCEELKCALAGNPPFEPTEARKPPEGPASRINIHVKGVNPQPVVPENGPIFLRYVLDSTPKCPNGNECYPPKDPLWTCTRADGKEVDLGRNGHDYYDCYNPIVRVYDYVPVTCCANTGLPGDCFTWSAPQGSITPVPGVSISPGQSVAPSSSVQPGAVQCAPTQQTVAINATARLQASGGNGTFSWNVGGGSLVEDSGSSVGVRFGVSGTKTVRVTSQGETAECTVNVQTPGATVIPSAGPSPSGSASPSLPGAGTSVTPTPSGRYVTPAVSGGATITPGPGTSDTDGDGITDRTECPDPYRCPDSSGDGIADWQDADVRNRAGRILSASEVATGPGEATALALIISALVSLLYVTYAHSPLGIRRDAEEVSKDQPPMDFRN